MPTPYGPLRGRLADHEGVAVLLVQRHSAGHRTPPHGVNYRAVADGLRRLGVRACFSSAAVGSLRSDWGPGTVASVTDFIDLTARRLTMWDRTVRHVDFERPFDAGRWLVEASGETCPLEPEAVYVGMDGPRYETPSEITMLRRIGGDVVGMTATTEAVCLTEVGITYGCLAVVTNLGCGLQDGGLGHEDVERVMRRLQPLIVDVLLGAAVRAAGR